jgi:hypothetical protein
MTTQRLQLSREATAALQQWRSDGTGVAVAVKTVLADLNRQFPGRSVELRVVPIAATQIIAGPVHRRGTPAATVEMTAEALLGLIAGDVSWQDEVSTGGIQASGERSDLSVMFPAVLPDSEGTA